MSLFYNYKNDDLFNSIFGEGSKLKYSDNINTKCNLYTKKGDDGMYVDMLLPGFSKSDITLNTNGDTITVECKNSNDYSDRDYTQQQFGYLSNIKRTWSIPKNYDPENITAAYNSGVLTLFIPAFKRTSSSKTIKIG